MLEIGLARLGRIDGLGDAFGAGPTLTFYGPLRVRGPPPAGPHLQNARG
jgi:hypothetical protein